MNPIVNPQDELKLVKKFIIISLVAHLVVAFVRLPNFFFKQIDLNDLSIDAELVLDMPDIASTSKGQEPTPVSAPAAAPAQEAPPMLPQLPKQFKTPEEEKHEDIAEIKAPKKELPEVDKERDKKLIELTKQEALNRLLKDRKRKLEELKPKPEKKNEQIEKIKDSLAKRKEQLAANGGTGTGTAIGIDELSRYKILLKSWVNRFYVLPETIRLNPPKSVANIEIVLDFSGKILSMRLVESSQNDGFDNLALQTLENASPLPQPPRELVGRPMTYRFDLGVKSQ